MSYDRKILFSKVGDRFQVSYPVDPTGNKPTRNKEIATFEIDEIYDHFCIVHDVKTGRKDTFTVGDLVIFGMEPSDYCGRDVERNEEIEQRRKDLLSKVKYNRRTKRERTKIS